MIGIEAGNVVEVNGQVEGFCGLVEVGEERLIAAHCVRSMKNIFPKVQQPNKGQCMRKDR